MCVSFRDLLAWNWRNFVVLLSSISNFIVQPGTKKEILQGDQVEMGSTEMLRLICDRLGKYETDQIGLLG